MIEDLAGDQIFSRSFLYSSSFAERMPLRQEALLLKRLLDELFGRVLLPRSQGRSRSGIPTKRVAPAWEGGSVRRRLPDRKPQSAVIGAECAHFQASSCIARTAAGSGGAHCLPCQLGVFQKLRPQRSLRSEERPTGDRPVKTA